MFHDWLHMSHDNGQSIIVSDGVGWWCGMDWGCGVGEMEVTFTSLIQFCRHGCENLCALEK